MNENVIGTLFILTGLAYGSLVVDSVYNATLGFLVEHDWIKPPSPTKLSQGLFGRKPTIIFYSLGLIAIGIYILIKLP
ncbi:MAG: hypothetical protein HYZ51_00105 [Candidatus Doudnabacteria bacterium]|nr:hypothetical protein [Candidatus Doudnabacteria bacterium]